MKKDYRPNLATGERIISDKGRPVTLQRLQSVALSPMSPKAGSSTVVQSLTIDAVFTDRVTLLGEDFHRDIEKVALIATDKDLTQYDRLLDGTDLFRIIRFSVFAPGNLRLLTYIGIVR
jgi:hypothetical protein